MTEGPQAISQDLEVSSARDKRVIVEKIGFELGLQGFGHMEVRKDNKSINEDVEVERSWQEIWV